jgi:hypothetical protein
MADWRDHVLREFTPGLGKAILVADPDRLFTDPMLSEVMTIKGFDLLLFEDSVAFRFAYESKYRSRLDRREFVDLVVLYQADSSSLQSLPYDLLVRSTQLAFALTDFFPGLSYPVLSALEPQYLDLLYRAQERFSPGVLGDNATKDFILRHVFEVAAELINSDADLLRVLLRRHYKIQTLPPVFVSRVVQVLAQTHRFDNWPLELLFQNRSAFFAFLQERWPIFLNRFLSGTPAPVANPVIPGPPDLPFESPDVRVYIDNLFVEGILRPVERPNVGPMAPSWFAFGILRDPSSDRIERLRSLLQILDKDLPSADARHEQWLTFAQAWAELVVLVVQSSRSAQDNDTVERFRRRVDLAFRGWIERRFGPLHNLSAASPVLVHHIARYLAGQRISRDSRIALVVVDGLAFDQWLVLRDELLQQDGRLKFEEGAVFAWVPTITSISRQTIFAGKAPLYFPSSVYTTNRELSLWTQFWAEQGIDATGVGYLKGLGEHNSLDSLAELASSPKTRVLGLIVDKVDRILHGMELGTAGMHNQVRQWAAEGFMNLLLGLLLSNGFDVYLTADHGNVEAAGYGRPKEGMLAEVRGERVRIYEKEALRSRVSSKFPEAIEWKPLGLPEDFLPLLAGNRGAFVPVGQRTVAHGGITLDEMVVPFVHVLRANQ